MLLLGIDIGTTNSKAGLFTENGQARAIASRPTVTHKNENGVSYYDPEQMWRTIADAIREATAKVDPAERIAAIGIASMAESGLLVDRASGKPQSLFMPWFDTCSKPQAQRIAAESDPFERFRASGLHGSFKLGLAKLLWIREHQPEALEGDPVWLSASGYIAYRLTGEMAFDYSLAARTYAFRIDRKEWDVAWIRQFGFRESIFPVSVPGGATIGRVGGTLAASLGLQAETPVGIAGHDHVAAALSVGSIVPGLVYDSMGTAETLVGTLPERELGREEFATGLSFGCHIAPNRHFWMGGNSMSGGSVEWLRGLLADEALSYVELLALLEEAKPGPTGILYYPYLAGSGAPLPDASARGAFIGLTKDHGKTELIQAVLEGAAYQLEAIRRGAQRIAGQPIDRLLVVGGGTRVAKWLQIKADVSAVTLELPPIAEATLLGAAMAAGVGSGVYASAEEAAAAVAQHEARLVLPDAQRHAAYLDLYERGYAALQEPLRAFYRG
ncbi:MAG: carbohydrate kinase [Paenibacillaceae bacterium]|nr:carbohydrate kinase [Paenibacillaceae bacterium]